MISNERQAQATLTQAVDLFNEENLDDALPLFEQSLQWYKDQHDKANEAIVHFFIGQILAAADDIEAARSEITTAHALFRDLGDDVGRARMRLELGELAYWEQHYDIANRHFERVVELLSGTDAEDVLAMAHARLGAIFTEEENLSAAREHYTAALDLYDHTGDTFSAANTLIELASAIQEEQPARARRLFERGRDLAQSAGSDYLASMALHGLGVLHADAEEWSDAVQSYKIALELKQRCDDHEGEIFTLLALGAAQRELQHDHSARQTWKKALRLAQEQDLDDVAEVARTLLDGDDVDF